MVHESERRDFILDTCPCLHQMVDENVRNCLQGGRSRVSPRAV
jgi:hypothetical protein